jgi:hypothetical protein
VKCSRRWGMTGYSAHFVVMDRKFQEEFVERVNYQKL